MDRIKIEKIFLLVGWVLSVLSVYWLYVQGVERVYFHQDDVVALGVIADWHGWSTVSHLVNEHLTMTFWLILHTLWVKFGIAFWPYLMVNVLMHVVVLFLIFVITYKITKSVLWSSLPVWGMVISPNWFAVVWWITGEMFMMTTIFALIGFWLILTIREDGDKWYWYLGLFLSYVLAGVSWGVGLTSPIWPLLVFGVDYTKKKINRIGWTLVASGLMLVVIYLSLVGKNISQNTPPSAWLTNPYAIFKFVVVGMSNTMVGRWLWPEENLRTRVFCLFAFMGIFFVSKSWKKLWSREVVGGMIIALGAYITYAIPRWSFGVGQAMANYYGYFPLPFLMIAAGVYLALVNPKGIKRLLIMSVFLLHIPLAWISFEQWVGSWLVRPQETRVYFESLNKLKRDQCIKNDLMPEFIVPDGKWKVDYLWPIFKKSWNPFCDQST